MRKLIGVTGNANVGKDTLADYIIKQNNTFIKHAFAKPIKDIMINELGFTEQQCYNQTLKHIKNDFWDITPRDAMLLIGTQLFRKQWRFDFWVKLTEHKILKQLNQNIIICDVRFDNEAEMIKKYGGKIILVTRRNNPIKVQHVSEAGIKKENIDYIIENNGTIEQFYQNIDSFKDLFI